MKKWHLGVIGAILVVAVIYIINRVPFLRSMIYGTPSATVSGT
jgi:hypothetical protein